MALFGKFPQFGKRPNASVEKAEVIPVIPEVQALFDEGRGRARTMVQFSSPGVPTETKRELIEAIDAFDSEKFRDDIMDPDSLNFSGQSFPKRVNAWMRYNLLPNLQTILLQKTSGNAEWEASQKLYDSIANLYADEQPPPFTLPKDDPPISFPK